MMQTLNPHLAWREPKSLIFHHRRLCAESSDPNAYGVTFSLAKADPAFIWCAKCQPDEEDSKTQSNAIKLAFHADDSHVYHTRPRCDAFPEDVNKGVLLEDAEKDIDAKWCVRCFPEVKKGQDIVENSRACPSPSAPPSLVDSDDESEDNYEIAKLAKECPTCKRTFVVVLDGSDGRCGPCFAESKGWKPSPSHPGPCQDCMQCNTVDANQICAFCFVGRPKSNEEKKATLMGYVDSPGKYVEFGRQGMIESECKNCQRSELLDKLSSHCASCWRNYIAPLYKKVLAVGDKPERIIDPKPEDLPICSQCKKKNVTVYGRAGLCIECYSVKPASSSAECKSDEFICPVCNKKYSMLGVCPACEFVCIKCKKKASHICTNTRLCDRCSKTPDRPEPGWMKRKREERDNEDAIETCKKMIKIMESDQGWAPVCQTVATFKYLVERSSVVTPPAAAYPLPDTAFKLSFFTCAKCNASHLLNRGRLCFQCIFTEKAQTFYESASGKSMERNIAARPQNVQRAMKWSQSAVGGREGRCGGCQLIKPLDPSGTCLLCYINRET